MRILYSCPPLMSREREHGIREGMKQDGTFYYITLEKQYKIMRLYNKC